MSRYAAQRSGVATDAASLKDALAGNLCRCTGYGPILAAGAALGASPDAGGDGALAAALEAIRPREGLALEHEGAMFFAPLSSDELAEVLAAHPDATVLAGGTDV